MKRILSFYLLMSMALSPNLALAQEKVVEKVPEKAPEKLIERVQEKSEKKEIPKEHVKKETAVIPARESKDEDILKGLDYPELQVVPRASDRLAMETQNEREYGWIAFWPYQISSISTLIAGTRLRGNYRESNDTVAEKRDSDNVAIAAMAVGAGGLGLSIFLIKSDLYGDSFRRIKAYKVTDKRGELFRERLSEEALEKPAHLINMLTTVSVSLNLLANVAVLTQANDDVRTYAVIGTVASVLPRMFTNRYVDNWTKQMEYKRKIYTPLIGFDWQYQPKNKEFMPQLSANWEF